MKNKATHFLIISLILVITICTGIFAWQTVKVKKRSAKTMNTIGEMYMSGMSEQITMHFGTVMEMKLSQVVALAEDVSSNHEESGSAIRILLTDHAKHRKFDNMAFYMENGNVDMVYGNQIVMSDAPAFVQSIKNKEKKIALGKDTEGNPVILIGVPLPYQVTEQERSIALVAGFSIDYIVDLLASGLDESMIFYVICRESGDIIIQRDSEADTNYFDKVKGHYIESGQVESEKEVEKYIENLKAAMADREDYTTEMVLKHGRRRLYCKSLPYSEWYLILSMPYNMLDEMIEDFGNEWTRTALFNAVIIIILFSGVFVACFYMIHQQIRSANEARCATEHAYRAKSEFLSNMSHDIRTPMNGIVGMTEIANANINDTEKVRDCLKKISLSSKHLLGLISDVLDMSKIDSGRMILNMEQISLPEVMQNVVNIIQPQTKSKNQRFDLHIHDILAEQVWGDSVRLNQILTNLLRNAVKFTPEGGTIQLELHQEASPKGDNYTRVHLHVIDNGIGISEEFKGKIFEAFMREDNARVQKTEGAGLGMSITKYIVDAMDGTILVNSTQGKGSEFHIILDMEMASVYEEEVSLPKWRTLVIDDDEVFCDCTVSTLKSLGIEAQKVLHGKEALKLIEEHHMQGMDYEVILLDWKLPEINGIEITRRIREKYGNLPYILMISAYDSGNVEEDAKQAGIDAFIVKPLFKSTLYYNLRKLMKEEENLTEKKEEENTDPFRGEHILIAEDNDLNWEIANTLLSGAGLQPDHAENGQICVDMFLQSPVGYYQAILMDLRMPVMTGYEAAMAIRALEREDAETIPIIAMSADTFADDVIKCLNCGMNAHTSKPIDVNKVIELLRKHMA